MFNFFKFGRVTSKTKYIPMNIFFLDVLNYLDKILVKLFPKIFCMGRRIVLIKLSDYKVVSIFCASAK